MSGANLMNLAAGNFPRIETESRKKEIRKKAPEAKRYIVYHETNHGEMDLNIDMRRKTRVGQNPYWQTVCGGKHSVN